ncbi:GH92 family glycosyl hydrolase [Ochrovirga pacifica]|uniref:GH92 family glycosyl hydrolase n=1 Tax=Ochrovirga pacifica TaxID=1042376 RepID=UPI00031B3AFC|nr:GH92 family glycosyl hydrolase [Ochrovirga pacifica]
MSKLMSKTKLIVLGLAILFCSCNNEKSEIELPVKVFTEYVNPFIGTGGHGHTYPGPSRPYGMVQLSPDTRLEGWDACSGYHYSDDTVYGFSHTHLSGTGIGDYGDILLLPTTGDIQFSDEKRIISKFNKKTEKAEVGYYATDLLDYGVKAELTSTTRVGMHQYTFPATDKASIIVDLTHSLQMHENKKVYIKVISDTEIEGMKITKGWATNQAIYFYAKFSKPFTSELYVNNELRPNLKEWSKGKNLRAKLNFKTQANEKIQVKVALSPVSCEGAKMNMVVELPHFNFNQIVAESKVAWNQKLSKINTAGGTKDQQTIFYTAMYHSMLSPNTAMDVDGGYMGMDQKPHVSDEFTNHTIFSLWDTFRGLHPLLTIINPEKDNELIKTLLQKRKEGGILPKWELASNYTGTMLGYHSVAVIYDAYVKGISDYNAEEALQAMIEASVYDPSMLKVSGYNNAAGNVMEIGKKYVAELGYIPGDKTVASVAKALEFAYNDWCIAQMAKDLGKTDLYNQYIERSKYYQKYYDRETQFMRGIMSDKSWRTPFNPNNSSHWKTDYCEGNAWQWSWFVPHDIKGFQETMGGKDVFTERLETLFTTSSKQEGEHVPGDISGLIGQYVHGNEPSHHIIHLFNHSTKPWLTQYYADKVMKEMYFNNPNGLAGNEDCGQMSAWYVLNAIGFYPICPGKPEYSIGRPIFDTVEIKVAGGKTAKIIAKNNSPENKYIKSVSINGKKVEKMEISHQDLLDGSTIVFEMSKTNN